MQGVSRLKHLCDNGHPSMCQGFMQMRICPWLQHIFDTFAGSLQARFMEKLPPKLSASCGGQ